MATDTRARPGAAARKPAVTVATFRNDSLFPRIERAVAGILAKGKVVAPIEVLVAMSLLTPEKVEDWRRGRVPYLEQAITCNLTRLSRLLRILRFHAHDLNLVPSMTTYVRWGKGPKQRLRFIRRRPELERPTHSTSLAGQGPLSPAPTPKDFLLTTAPSTREAANRPAPDEPGQAPLIDERALGWCAYQGAAIVGDLSGATIPKTKRGPQIPREVRSSTRQYRATTRELRVNSKNTWISRRGRRRSSPSSTASSPSASCRRARQGSIRELLSSSSNAAHHRPGRQLNFSRRGRSWQVAPDWDRQCPYFQSLAATAETVDFAREVHRVIKDFDKHNGLRHLLGTSSGESRQKAALRAVPTAVNEAERAATGAGPSSKAAAAP
jgi:hypothetical protein